MIYENLRGGKHFSQPLVNSPFTRNSFTTQYLKNLWYHCQARQHHTPAWQKFHEPPRSLRARRSLGKITDPRHCARVNGCRRERGDGYSGARRRHARGYAATGGPQPRPPSPPPPLASRRRYYRLLRSSCRAHSLGARVIFAFRWCSSDAFRPVSPAPFFSSKVSSSSSVAAERERENVLQFVLSRWCIVRRERAGERERKKGEKIR